MRQGGPNNRRPRGRHHGGGGERHHGGGAHQGGGNSSGPPRDNRPRSAASLRHQTFDSNCIDLRVRGNAWQVNEKYQALARDAQSSGDRVAAENYLQHAEHYFRIIEAINEATAAEQRARGVPVTPFGQQPEVPTNYYGTPGNPAAPPQPGNEEPNGNSSAPPQQAQAEVQKRQPPQAQQSPNPFFAPEESEEAVSGPEQIVARR
jgi:hypothetical protein